MNAKQNQLSFVKVYEIVFILVSIANYLIVVFDALYLYKLPYYHGTLRDILLHYYPEQWKSRFDIISLWDSLKGIEPHRFNLRFEEEYQKLKELYPKLAGATPIERLGIEREIDRQLQILTSLTDEMIDKRGVDSHFYIAGKDGVLEKIKNKMRAYKPNPENSAKQSFREFFSRKNLDNDRYIQEFEYFDKEILIYIRENYFRWIDEDGELKDYFFKIDRWFVLFFWFDFLGRWILTARRYSRWYLFPVHHFYEIFNLYPPHHNTWFRLLRIIPIYVRMRRNRFLPDEGILPEIIHENAKVIADEISGLVLLNIIEQTKSQIAQKGKFQLEPQTIEVLQTILKKQMEIFSFKVMPRLEPLITEMVHFSINRAAEPYLLSPIGPVVRLLLLNIHTTVREGLEASFNSPEGLERLNKILQTSLEETFNHFEKQENQDLLIEDIVKFLEILKIDLENNFVKNGNITT
ncbi:MAG: hypothetical protein NZ853_04730 [Leptospiraceae bacterium]|nr:hypothetical protein [Leptospiraceae bacterium]MDW7975923.1 hypothetical protein [Leptospiraceae bacterium]